MFNEGDHKNDQPTNIYKKKKLFTISLHLIIIIMGNTWDCKYLIYSNISQHFSIQLKNILQITTIINLLLRMISITKTP